MAHHKKRKSAKSAKSKQDNEEKRLSVRFDGNAKAASSKKARPWKLDSTKKSRSNRNSPNMSPLQSKLNRFEKAKSMNNMVGDSDDDGMESLDLTRHKKHGRGSSHLSHQDYKSKYNKKVEQNSALKRTVKDQQFTINNLKKELKKYTKSEYHEYDSYNKTERNYERKIKHKEKEIANLRRRLKLAINDYEKVYQYYKKQLDLFSKNQRKWLNEQRSNGRDVTKYVFADDIRKIKIRKKGIRIYFGDGEDVVFDNIEIIKGSDYNDDDQYRNLVKKVRDEEEIKKDDLNKPIIRNGHNEHSSNDLDDDDMIILCLNELRSRIYDKRHEKEDNYYNVIKERYDKLPIYHIDNDYLHKLKTNNASWIKLFRKATDKMPVIKGSQNKKIKRKGRFGAFFTAQKEMKSGKQPTICVQNNVILNNINNHHSKPKNKSYAAHLQEKIDRETSENNNKNNKNNKNKKKMNEESKNDEGDENFGALKEVSILNGWFTAQIEMQRYNQQPSVCIKNNINLGKLQKPKSKFKLKKKIRGKAIQQRLDRNRNNRNNGNNGHCKIIAMDKGDSSEEDENGNDIYNKGNILIGDSQRITGFSNIMNGWFSAQMDIADSKQPTICVQNNVILANIENTKEMIDFSDPQNKNNKKKKKKKKNAKFNAKKLQKKLNETTSNGLSKNALDLSDDEEDENELNNNGDDEKYNDDKIHENMWYYKNTERRKFILSLKINSEKTKLLKQIGTYLNRIIPTSMDYNLIKYYMPIFNNIYDIICALFDGVLLSVLINFIDDNLIDLRALHLAENKYPISREEIIENMYVIKSSIDSLDLHEFPNFAIDFDIDSDDEDAFCWYNPLQTVDIMLLIIMHAYMGMMNTKINIFKYPELFRLCQHRDEKREAQKCSAKEWLTRWIIFIKRPKIKRHGRNLSKTGGQDLFSSIDLGGYHSPVKSGNISWESIKINQDAQHDEHKYIWDTNRDFYDDICLIHDKLSMNNNNIKTFVEWRDIEKHRNYLLQLIYLSDLFLFNNKIDKLSGSEQKLVMDYLKKIPRDDLTIIAWINSFKIQNDSDGTYQYVDNLGTDLSDGVIILNILDQCKPGCVDWKNRGLRTSSEIRHKFDKLANCNEIKSICNKSFGDVFHLIGMGGNDIVDQNPKYIRSLLLQIQRYHSTKLMAKILFKKKNVTDDELLKWLNNRLSVYKQMVAAMNKMHNNDISIFGNNQNIKMKKNVIITSFEDKFALSDSINFCNVVSSINPKWINYHFINNEDEITTKQDKIQNAKYLITIMRRLGSDNIFVTPIELIECEHRAILAMSTAIMTVAARYNQYDQLALFAKNLKQIKAKMAKR